MPATEFLDANILVYAYDPSDERKQQIARELVRQAVDGLIVTSVQVLAEFSSTLLHKQKSLASANDVRAVLDALAAIPVMAPNAAMVRRAIEAHEEYGIHFYDGMIVAAAERAGCTRIWSEDLNSGQEYFGAVVEHPFV